MTADELRGRVGEILKEEDRQEVDWQRVEQLCEGLIKDLYGPTGSECPEAVWHYLFDADIREKDEKYGAGQRKDVRHFVETGEYTDSTPVSGWGCLAVVSVVGAIAYWFAGAK